MVSPGLPDQADIIGLRDSDLPLRRRSRAMKALITGAAGFVGPHLSAALTAAGDEVVGLDQQNGPDLLDGPGWIDTLARHRPEVVYHLAGWSDVSGSWRDPVTTVQINTVGTLSVLEAARAAGTERVVVVSSADVYGIVDPEHQPITETHPLCPRSPYGASKEAAEALARQYHRGHDLDVIVARPFNHIGPGQSPRFVAAAFAFQVAEAEQRGHGTLAHGDLTARRDLTDVRDVVAAYRLLALHGDPGEVYNVCSGEAVAMKAVLDHFLDRASVTITTEVDPARLRPVELPVLAGSAQKLHQATGWSPTHSLDATLTDVLDDARARVAA